MNSEGGKIDVQTMNKIKFATVCVKFGSGKFFS